MGYVLLLFAIASIIPAASTLRQNPQWVPMYWTVVGISCFMYTAVDRFGISLISWGGYPGHTKQIEVTILDILLAIYFFSGLAGKTEQKLPFRLPMKIYFGTVLLSTFFAGAPMAVSFYATQLLRMYFVYVVIARSCADPRVIPSLLNGFSIALIWEFFLVVYQKFVGGAVQPSGSFGHQNALGMIANLVLFPQLALMLATPGNILRASGIATGFASITLLASRGSLALGFVGAAFTFLLSTMKNATGRKARFAMLGAVGMAVLIPVAIASLESRFKGAEISFTGDGEEDERERYKAAAAEMLSDHPMGVGANQFVSVANVGGYYDRANVVPTANSRGGTVHNIYWLTLAELGYLGFAAFMLLIGSILFRCFRAMMTYPSKTMESELLCGLSASFLILFVHSYFEWILVTTTPQYFVAILIGILAHILMKQQAAEEHALILGAKSKPGLGLGSTVTGAPGSPSPGLVAKPPTAAKVRSAAGIAKPGFNPGQTRRPTGF